ncbi:MAG TPA: metal-sulfur cluster assembly factor [Gemmatimonadaceae bacterium]|nr:metal-sulfur cluster assembly factor [Gemmatimonadaceae bacterium]
MSTSDEHTQPHDPTRSSASAQDEPGIAGNSNKPDDGSTTGEGVSEEQVKAALRKVKDPELNLNILDLGLIYTVAVDGSVVNIDMSLTSPGCPSGPEIMTNAEQAVREIPGVTDVTVNLVWSPYWSPDRIEPRIRAYLGM